MEREFREKGESSRLEPFGLGLSMLLNSYAAFHGICGKSQDIHELPSGSPWILSMGENYPCGLHW